MATVQEQLKLKRVPIDKWSTKEQLCLSSSVLRSGDQNWMSVSRTVRMFGEPNRPEDWFSQKNCAVQYSSMLEKAETPKRKKRSGNDKEGPFETPGEIIVRKFTGDRIEELKKLMDSDRAAYLKLQKEVELIQSGNATEEQLTEWATEMENGKKQKEVDAQNHVAWLKERERKKAQLERTWKPQVPSPTTRRKHPSTGDGSAQPEIAKESENLVDNSLHSLFNTDVLGDETAETKPMATTPTSPFLTSLLKNPSPTKVPPTSSILHSAITSQRATPTITSLLSSSPSVPQTHVTKPLGQNALIQEEAAVPTLSMLLQLPSNVGDKVPQLNNQELVTQSGDIRHPQHQEYQLSKDTETDEILDVVDVEQAMADGDDLEPIEIGLEEIIADLEQSVTPLDVPTDDNSNIQSPVITTSTIDAFLGEQEGTTENLSNADSFHKIFDDFYSMNVTKQRPDSGEGPEVRSKVRADIESKHVPVPVKIAENFYGGSMMNTGVEVAVNEEILTAREIVVEEDLKDKLDDNMDVNEKLEEIISEDLILEPEEVEQKTNDDLDNLIMERSAEIDEEPVMRINDMVNHRNTAIVVDTLEPILDNNYLPNLEEDINVNNQQIDDCVPIVDETKIADVLSTDEVATDPEAANGLESLVEQPDNFVKETTPEPKASIDPNLSEIAEEKSEDLKENDEGVESEPEKPDADVPLIDDEDNSTMPLPSDATEETSNDANIESAKTDLAQIYNKVSDSDERVSKPEDKVVDAEKIVESENGKDKVDIAKAKKDSIEVTKEIRECDFGSSDNSSQEKTDVGAIKLESNTYADHTPTRRMIRGRVATPAIDSLPSSPASITTDEEKEYRVWKRAILIVWNGLAAHKYASIFCKPITDDHAPGYSTAVLGPVDLSSIKRSIETGTIRTTADFQRDVLRMFFNAVMYNRTGDNVHKMALEMQKDSIQQIQDFILTQKLILTPGEGNTRRETRTTDSAGSSYKRKRDSEISLKMSTKKRKV